MKIEISAVITLYNKKKYIERCILSVLKQSIQIKEIIVIDDGSTDEGQELVRSMLSGVDNLRLITQKNQGVSVARNRGAQEATANIVCFLDADDEWLPCFAEEISFLARQCPEASVYSLRHEWVNSQGSHVRQRVALPRGFSGVVEDFIDVYRKGYGIIHSSCVGIRKEIFSKYDGFPSDAKKSQDIYFWLVLGMYEKIAFRDVTAVLRYEESSGVSLRNRHVSYHITTFMDPAHQPNYSTSDGLAKFLKKSIFVMILENKLTNNESTTSDLLKYGHKFGHAYYAFLVLFSFLPVSLVRQLRVFQQILKKFK